MARFTRTVAAVVAEPRLLAQELDRFRQDKSCSIPASSREAIASTVVTAIRHALRAANTPDELAPRAEALTTDIRGFIPSLHVHAKAAARLKGHQDAGDAEGRAHRFVEWFTGGRRFDERSRVDWPCPDAMLPLAPYGRRVNIRSELALLHRLATLAGVRDVPRRFPSYDALVAQVLEINAPVRNGVSPHRDVVSAATRRVTAALSAYRKARERLLEHAAESGDEDGVAAAREAFAPCPKPPVGRAVHIGVHDEVHAILRADGLVPEEMTAFEILRAVNPALAHDYEEWCAGAGAGRSPSFREQCEDALLRVGGWAVIAGKLPEFRALESMDELFATQVAVEQKVTLTPRQRREIIRRGANPELVKSERISLLEALVEAAAPDALRRSSVAKEDVPLGPNAKPYLIDGMYAVCVRLWSMAEALYAAAAGQDAEDAARWALASANWTHLLEELKARRLPGEYVVHAKDKKRLIELVTLPQLLCIAFPLRRRELRALRARWQAARADAIEKGHDPEAHAGVRSAQEVYLSQAVRHTMLAITLDDGMRKQQYTHGCLGYDAHFRPIWKRRGERRSGAIEGIVGMHTYWTGDVSDPAHFKIRERKHKLDKREGREVRGGTVDMEILWDVITLHRPRQLVEAGLVPSLAAYDLEADMQAGRWALFPSSSRVKRKENSRTDVSKLVGRELHYLVRTFLRSGPNDQDRVPAWEDLDESWRALWSQHVTRLLSASYIGGVRQEWDRATELLKDREETLRAEYSVVNGAIKDKLGLNRSHWEHPNAFDPWMDRLLWEKEVFDPLEDPALPLPDHVRRQLEEERTAARRRRRPPGSGVRIRQRRAGQPLPPGAANAQSVDSSRTERRRGVAR